MLDLADPVDVLARTVWGEARGEGRAGMEAVANVVLNRVELGGWWGDTVIEVCRHPRQFSCWDVDDPNLPKLLAVTGADPAFVTALAVAEDAINGDLIDATNRADSYYRAGTPVPAWARGLIPCATIGHHLFFRTRQ